MDLSGFEGTNCYCSQESARLAREMVRSLPLDAVHLIGTGDYHYATLFWAERMAEDFVLVLMDNHSDDQPGAFGPGQLSCGNWVLSVRELPHCRKSVWIRSAEDFRQLEEIRLPVYLSIDLDVLSREFAHTDWNQGDMTLRELESAIKGIPTRIAGVDICGGTSESKGGTEEDAAMNQGCVRAIMQALEEQAAEF